MAQFLVARKEICYAWIEADSREELAEYLDGDDRTRLHNLMDKHCDGYEWHIVATTESGAVTDAKLSDLIVTEEA